MRKCAAILFILIPAVVVGQKIKYKDVFPVISTATEDKAKNELIQYLFTDLHHPNANLRLAMIYENSYKRSDVLTEYKRALAFAEKAKLQYLKCKAVIDEKEVSRNEEYYGPFASEFDKKGRPEVEYSTVKLKIDNGYDSAVLFIEKIPAIYENFTRAVNSYGQAYKEFYELNNEYKSLDDLLMLYDEELKARLLNIKSSLDTALARFGKYQVLIKDYPVNGYNQKINLQPLVYYRLDGLSAQSSFLQDNITLWDYSSWVDNIISLHNSEIKVLKNGIATLENDLNQKIIELEKADIIEEEDFVIPDKELLHQVSKYDYQSVALGIIDYKAFKQKLIRKEKQKLFYDTATQQNSFSKFNFYSDLLKHESKADSLLVVLAEKIEEEKIAKHEEFINKNYGGKIGLENFVNKEKSEIVKDFNFYKLTLRNNILDELTVKDSQKEWVKYNKYELPLFLNENDSASLANNSIIATAIEYRADSSVYIAGYLKPEGTVRNIGYLARLDPDKNVQWVKEYDIAIDSGAIDSSTKFIDIEVTKDGCAVISRSRHITKPLSVNTFLYLNDDGTEKINSRLEYQDFPRKIVYDQNNNRFIIALKGDDPEQDLFTEEELSLVAYNTLGDRLWERAIPYAGSFIDFLNMQDGYLLIGNYTNIKDPEGNIYRTKAQRKESNSFALKFTAQGDVFKLSAFEKPDSYYISKVYKVNDGNINLFGLKGTYNSSSGELSYNNDDLFHIMIGSNLEEITIK